MTTDNQEIDILITDSEALELLRPDFDCIERSPKIIMQNCSKILHLCHDSMAYREYLFLDVLMTLFNDFK